MEGVICLSIFFCWDSSSLQIVAHFNKIFGAINARFQVQVHPNVPGVHLRKWNLFPGVLFKNSNQPTVRHFASIWGFFLDRGLTSIWVKTPRSGCKICSFFPERGNFRRSGVNFVCFSTSGYLLMFWHSFFWHFHDFYMNLESKRSTDSSFKQK